eukprot:gene34498-41768_t
MGIKGLLPLLASIKDRLHLSALKDMAVGVDARSWLYKAAAACPKEVAKGHTPAVFLAFLRRRVDLLTNAGITNIIFVFDGCELKTKEGENRERRRRRDDNLDCAKRFEEEGNEDEADKLYRRGIKVLFCHVLAFIEILKEKRLPFLVAPYEADAQLTYFSNISAIDIVISDDSDMLVYGCKAVLFKLDAQGEGDLIKLCDIGHNKDLVFRLWTDEQFKLFCCLAGCDYVESLPRVGIKTAYYVASKCKTLPVLLNYVRSHYHATADYCHRLTLAYYTYHHHHVYCPLKNCIIPLTPIKDGVIDAAGIMGQEIPSAHVDDLIRGRIDPANLFRPTNQQESKVSDDCESVSSITSAWNADVVRSECGEHPGKHNTIWTSPAVEGLNSIGMNKKTAKKRSLNHAENTPSAQSNLWNGNSYESPLVSSKLQRVKRKVPMPFHIEDQQKRLSSTLETNDDEAAPFSPDVSPCSLLGMMDTRQSEVQAKAHHFFDAEAYLGGYNSHAECSSHRGSLAQNGDPKDIRDSSFISKDAPTTLSSIIDRDLYQVIDSKKCRIAHLLGNNAW